MPRSSPFRIRLTAAEAATLAAVVRRYTAPYRDVIRAKIILYAARGLANDAIAQRLDTPPPDHQHVAPAVLPGAPDRLGGAVPPWAPGPLSPPSAVVEIKALACERPSALGLPLARFSVAELHREAVRRGLVAAIGQTTIWRWLSEDAIRPWRYRSWIFPRDPQFTEKAGRVLDLYERVWAGTPLGDDEYVLCVDEKTSIQARRRCHATAPPAPGRRMRVEHEYERQGAWAYLAAWDVHRATLFGRCERRTGIAPFDRLVRQVMTQAPYRSATRVFWVVDNGSSHRGHRAGARLQGRYPNLILVHTPIHASWLNQVEIYCSVVQRKVLTPNDLRSLGQLRARLLRFQGFYERAAQPFRWQFTRRDLAALLRKLATPCDGWRQAA